MENNGSEPQLTIPDPDDYYARLTAQIPDMQMTFRKLEEQRAQLGIQHQRQQDELRKRQHDELEEIQERRRKLSALLKALGVDEPLRRTKRTRAAQRASGVKRVGQEVMSKILDVILAHADDETFTRLSIHAEVDPVWSVQTTYQAFTELLALEVIGLARIDGKQESFRIMPGGRDLAERIKQDEEVVGSTATRGKDGSHYNPGMGQIQRHLEIIASLDQESFTPLDLFNRTGLRSPKATYGVVRWLRENGLVEEAGKRLNDDGKAQHAQQLYRIKNPEGVQQIMEGETLNA